MIISNILAKNFQNEENFLNFIKTTTLTPHATLTGCYNAVAAIAKAEGIENFSINKSTEKAKVSSIICQKMAEERKEKFFSSWQALKEFLTAEQGCQMEGLEQFDEFFEGIFYFVILSELTVAEYSSYGTIAETKSLAIFSIKDSTDKSRIDIKYNEVFSIDRQFGKGKISSKKEKGFDRAIINLKIPINATKALFYALNNKKLYNSYKKEILAQVENALDLIIDEEFNRQEAEKERIEKEKKEAEEKAKQKAEQKAKQKEAQKKAKEEADKKEAINDMIKALEAAGKPLSEEQIKALTA